MARKINKVKSDLRSYPHYVMMGQPKVGKTTLFRDLVLLVYNDASKGLLISCGEENGYQALDNLQVEDAKSWDDIEDENGNRGLVQIVDELIELRGTDEQIEMVGFDTFDELVNIARDQVFEEHRDTYNKYPISLNDALGGYGRGVERVNALIREQIARLNNAGMAVFILAHTKVKDKSDPLSGEKYEMITNDLDSRFYNPIANTAQMIVNIVLDRKIEGAGTEKKKISKDKEITVDIAGRTTSCERYMYFRDDNFVDAGARFVGLPEKLPLSAENFMKAFEIGVENSRTQTQTKAEIKKQVAEENEANNTAGQKLLKKEMTAKKEDLAKEITSILSVTKDKDILTKVAQTLKDKDIKGFDTKSLAEVNIDDLKEIIDMLK